jgi:hypothetical protein
VGELGFAGGKPDFVRGEKMGTVHNETVPIFFALRILLG